MNQSLLNDDVIAKVPNLKQFAFRSSIDKRRYSSLDSSNCCPMPPLSGKRAPHIQRAPRKMLNPLLSLSDFAKVFRCICCNISWTTRKTAIQKMDHILRCAKKHAYDDDTVRTLVKKEIDSAPPFEGKKHEPSKMISNPSTLFEDLIHESARKQKNKSQMEGNLACGSSVRETMLTRAQCVIRTRAPDEVTLDDVHDDNLTPMPTESLLEGGYQHQRILNKQTIFHTQNFAASRLVTVSGPLRAPLFAATHQDDDWEREYSSFLPVEESTSTPWCEYSTGHNTV